jgi:Ser/Thr protein kinase RdoA (MazF antagonist)
MTTSEFKNVQEIEAIEALLAREYGVAGEIVALPGEHDLNFRIQASDGRAFLLKLHVLGAPEELDMQIAVLDHLAREATDLPVSKALPSRSGASFTRVEFKGERVARLLTWLPGEIWARAANRSSNSVETLGALLGKLDRSLAGFSHPGARREYAWDIARAEMHLANVDLIEDVEKRSAVRAILDHFVSTVLPRLEACPRQVIHNDANDYNVLVGADGRVSGLLDFGDMVESYRVVEVAVASAYALIGSPDPIGAIARLAGAYQGVNRLGETEAELIFDLVRTRYAVSICTAARQIRDNPENAYLLVSQEDVWRELKRLEQENRLFAIARIRDVCGFAPIARAARVVRWLERNAHDFSGVIKPGIARPKAAVFDFSASSAENWAGLDKDVAQARIEPIFMRRGRISALVSTGRIERSTRVMPTRRLQACAARFTSASISSLPPTSRCMHPSPARSPSITTTRSLTVSGRQFCSNTRRARATRSGRSTGISPVKAPHGFRSASRSPGVKLSRPWGIAPKTAAGFRTCISR